MSRPKTTTMALLILLGAVLATVPGAAQTTMEYLGILDTGGSYAEFGTPGLPALPADFFGPGSDPFEGQVALVPATPIHPDAANSSLLITWPAPPMSPSDIPGTMLTTPVDIQQLLLKSQQPVNVTYLGGATSESWEMELTLSGTLPAPGTSIVTKDHANGGTFEIDLPLQPRFVFTRISDGQVMVLDSAGVGWPPLILAGSAPGDWVHEPDPKLQLMAALPPVFTAGVLEAVWGDPGSQCPLVTPLSELSGGMLLELVPAELIPPPDPWCAVPGSEPDGSHIVFGPGDNPSIPADFFGPGSDPFDGVVALEGVPLGPTPWGEYEDADTLIRRDRGPFDRCAPFGVGFSYDEVEPVALSLRAMDPLVVTYTGGMYPELWDMTMELAPGSDPSGILVANKTHPNGGDFDTYLAFHPYFVFTRQSDGQVRTLDAALAGRPYLDFECFDGFWVHTANPDLMLLAPSAGHFVPAVEEGLPGDPMSQGILPLHFDEFSGAGVITLRPTLSGISGVEVPHRREMSLVARPNPFNPQTILHFELGKAGPVSLRIFDLHGRLVRTVLREMRPAGPGEASWRGADERGRPVASGIYFGVLETAEGRATTKLAVIK